MNLEKLLKNDFKTDQIYLPEFFRLNKSEDYNKLEGLLNRQPVIHIYDQLQGQLEELIKLLNPKKKFNKETLAAAVKEHLGNKNKYEYGVWVYYPWSLRLVHILDEFEFVNVRTNRNVYKITPAERDILSKQKIGVIGLSVGQSVAVTMATERVFGEIRLADFDILELTNLNRIRTGIHNIGVSKVISVAREIVEIDPFLKVTCFSKGLLEENMNDFFLNDGKLDLLIEECDSFDIKILSRIKARELKIPVVMETSDRGMVDIERFDIEPGRKIFHGLIEHLDISQIKNLKNAEDKYPFLAAILGINTISKRLKSSIAEIGNTILTWPQLASSVTMGGGVVTDICRRIALNQFRDSGRYYVDVETLIKDKNHEGN